MFSSGELMYVMRLSRVRVQAPISVLQVIRCAVCEKVNNIRHVKAALVKDGVVPGMCPYLPILPHSLTYLTYYTLFKHPSAEQSQPIVPQPLTSITRTGSSNCYVDQASACDEPNAVPCTNLKKGVSKACCPRLTSCSDGYEASEEFVRCNIQYDDLFHPTVVVTATLSESGKVSTVTLSPSSSSSSTSTTISSSSSRAAGTGGTQSSESTPLPGIPVPSSTTPAQQGPSPTPESSPAISTGAIAGICVSVTLACALVAVLIWIVLRRRRKAAAEKSPAPSDSNQSGSDQDTRRDVGSPLVELPHTHTYSEAPGDSRPYSYVVRQNGVEYYKPMELMTQKVMPVELQGDAQMGAPGQWQEQQQYGPFEIMTNPRGSGEIRTPRAELAAPTPRAELGTST